MNAWLPWIHALGWTLLHFLWQGLVVGAGFAAVRALLPKSHCNARYAAGLGALALLAAWPLATLISLRPQGSADAAAISDGVAIGAAVLAQARAMDLAASVDRVLPWLVLVWGVGVFGVAGRALHQWRTFTRIARQWAESSPELDAMLLALTRRFGFMRRVRVLVSERIDTPMLLGWLRPIVLLPTAVALGFPRQQVELILAHELGHLRRYDHLVNLAQAVLETLLFYHPVVHWISREVRNERELCCDALVLRLIRGEPREYARTLAALEELRQTAAPIVLAASGGQLLERVRRIVGLPAPRAAVRARHPGRWFLIGAAFLGALLVAQRLERSAEQAFNVEALRADWLKTTDWRSVPFAALTLPYERPHLRVATLPAAVPPVTPAITPATTVPAAVTTSAPARDVKPLVDNLTASPAVADIAPPAAEPQQRVEAPSATPLGDQVAKIAPVVEHKPTVEPIMPSKPVATRVVAPNFPSYYSSQSGRVEATFAIAPDGSVRDIEFVGAKGGAFERAAELALRQWRFDPATLQKGRSVRYTQGFVFAPKGGANTHEECVQSTGSLICRDPSDLVNRTQRVPAKGGPNG
jgi:TonB family protein